MGGMFYEAAAFNNGEVTNTGSKPLNWDVSKVTDMADMFARTNAFNQDISSWVVSNVTNMGGMFEDATSFKQNLLHWSTNGSGFNAGLSETIQDIFKGATEMRNARVAASPTKSNWAAQTWPA